MINKLLIKGNWKENVSSLAVEGQPPTSLPGGPEGPVGPAGPLPP